MKWIHRECGMCRRAFKSRYGPAGESFCRACRARPTHKTTCAHTARLERAKQWTERHEVMGNSGYYVVSLHHTGYWACSCPRWKFKREQCKHIEEVLWVRAHPALAS